MRENEVLTSISSRKSPFNSQFAIRNSQFRKDFGIFFTPDWVVDFIIGLISDDKTTQKRISILEPACGMGQFL
ncbi:MAG: N-6 DNA methylase, partial [Chloroherpetonaceae bacterium]|nr:N-6 DNA methylase [Chloroherpetonaceae bacterium]